MSGSGVRRSRASSTSSTTLPTSAIALPRRRELLANALGYLPGDDREILVMRDLEGLSGEETGQLPGLSMAALITAFRRELAAADPLEAAVEVRLRARPQRELPPLA